MAWVDGLLLDIDGVLTVSWQPIDGAAHAIDRLRSRGLPLRFATNTTTRSRAEVARLLTDAGIPVDPSEILTAPIATVAYLQRAHPGARCFVLSSGDLGEDLEPIDRVDDAPADVVVMGGAGLVYTHTQLNRAFRLLLDGAAFVAMHRNLYWRTADGMELDTGAYVTALEQASGVSPVVLGKPSPDFFAAAVTSLGVPAERTAMIGDDIVNDVLGAQAAGLRGVLVRTGKYRPDAVEAASGTPDRVVDSIADVPDLV